MGTKYKVLVLLLLCVLSFGCAHKKSPAVDDAAAQYERYKALYGANGDMEGGDWDWGENDPSVSGQVLRRAHNALGTPYVWGGEHPGGFDCSGLVQWAYRGAGVKLPRTAQEQSSVGFKIRDVSKMRAGDIVAFRRRDGGYHTGIYIGSGMFIHAPKRHSRVQVESLDSDWYSTHFIGARRVNMGSGDAAVAEASRIADEENAREEAQARREAARQERRAARDDDDRSSARSDRQRGRSSSSSDKSNASEDRKTKKNKDKISGGRASQDAGSSRRGTKDGDDRLSSRKNSKDNIQARKKQDAKPETGTKTSRSARSGDDRKGRGDSNSGIKPSSQTKAKPDIRDSDKKPARGAVKDSASGDRSTTNRKVPAPKPAAPAPALKDKNNAGKDAMRQTKPMQRHISVIPSGSKDKDKKSNK